MTNELLFRYITSGLVICSLPPLLALLWELRRHFNTTKSSDPVQIVLLIIYLTFLVSGIITLYINIQFQFFGAKTANFTALALFRNIIKQIGIVFVSWRLYFITREKR